MKYILLDPLPKGDNESSEQLSDLLTENTWASLEPEPTFQVHVFSTMATQLIVRHNEATTSLDQALKLGTWLTF